MTREIFKIASIVYLDMTEKWYLEGEGTEMEFQQTI